MSSSKPASTLLLILAFATVYLVWGSTYFFIQMAVKSFPPLLLGAFRFLAAGGRLLGWCALKGEKLFVIRDVGHAAVSGILLLFVGIGIVIWVEQTIPSAMVAILVSSSPIWFIVLDKKKWKENFRNKATMTGLLVGFGGVILLFSEQIMHDFSISSHASRIMGMVLLLIGTIAWSAGSLYSKYKQRSGSALVNTAWQMITAGIVFIPCSFLHGEVLDFQWQQVPASAWFALIYLVVFGSIAAFSAYVWLLQVRPATQVSTYAYINPLIAVVLGVFFAHEHISSLQLIGLIIILGSVLLINLEKYRKARFGFV
ncbi:MAG: EamA family transporter [Sediminibacterium sp.]